ncbi:MAG TPA: hypothetical protein VFW73_12745 [Lacipirellulaceae bacterium]|nr:hypothetical protein [Lacipirellulaceae bacterium]
MTIRAENDPRFSRRFLYMGILAIAFSLWCLYDGLIGYPRKRLKGFDEFKSDYQSLFADSKIPKTLPEFTAKAHRENADHSIKDAVLTWDKYAHDRSIPVEANIVFQFIMTGIAAFVGVLLIAIPLRRRNQWIELDDTSLRTSWGKSFNIDQIESMNKRKWRNKGLATITYRQGNRKRVFTIDDMKFMRGPTDAILFEIEQRVGVERITGGPPESNASDTPDTGYDLPPSADTGTEITPRADETRS